MHPDIGAEAKHAPTADGGLSIVEGATRAFRDAAIHELFASQVDARPDAVALVCGSETLSYADLDRRTNRLARHLRSVVGRDAVRIGVDVSRSCDLIVALLATLKAGFAYVPLDPTHPALRRRAILAEADVAALIVDSDVARDDASEGVPVIDLVRERDVIARRADAALGLRVDPRASAYVIFTSGTTGVPKGVEVAHRSLVNLVTTMAVEPGFAATDTLVAVTTISFDMAVFEIFVPLAAGGTVVIATNDDVIDGFRLRALLDGSQATMLQSTPATWRLLLEAGFRSPASFRMLSGGEPLQRALADRLLAGDGELWNVYGPTETTVYATRMRVTGGASIAIGRPLDNTQAYVLDEFGLALELGSIGELYIGGEALALGYFNAPELTARKFVPNPFHGGRMFRTGDAARMREDGTIETFGRLDDQVKLRGFRIELGEIESTIARDDGVAAVAVALRHRGDDSPQLVAYVVPRSTEAIDVAALATRLGAELPEYMVPTAWHSLEALPLNVNGKLDRRALPSPKPAPATHAALATPLERQLGDIWSGVLGRTEIGRDDDIFALGADSLQIFGIAARARRDGIDLAPRDVMRGRTIANIATALLSPEPRAEDPPHRANPLAGATDRRDPALFFHSDLFADGYYADEIAAAIPERRVIPIGPHGVGDRPLRATISAMAEDYVANLDSIQPAGPYRLLGFCAGALVAFEVARLLRERGETVERLVLINAAAPVRPVMPMRDRIIFTIARNPRLGPRFREALVYNVERCNRALLAGPRATTTFFRNVVFALASGRRAAQRGDGETFVRAAGDALSELSFAHIGAALAHHPHPYDGEVTLVWSVDQPDVTGEPSQGWNRLASSVKVVPMHGGHIAPVHDLVGELSEILRSVL